MHLLLAMLLAAFCICVNTALLGSISGTGSTTTDDKDTDFAFGFPNLPPTPPLLTDSAGYQNGLYTWNKQNTSSEKYLTGFGLPVCFLAASTSVIGFKCTSPETFGCDCSPWWCHTYGTCCHDLLNNLTSPSPLVGCLQSQYYALVRCPAEWRDEGVRERCERGRGVYTEEEPVTDVTGSVTYRNEWCARCHDVTSFTRWAPSATCQHFQFLYTAVNPEDFLQRAVQQPQVCEVQATPPEGLDSQHCRPAWFARPPIRTCNVTGDWRAEDYDEEVEANCLHYQSTALLVLNGSDTVFQNLFCAICNGVQPTTEHCHSGIITPGGNPPPITGDTAPLSLLLSLDISHGQSLDNGRSECPPGEWLDPKKECRQLQCTAGKVFTNSTCLTPLSQIGGLVYQLDMAFTLPEPELVVSSGQYAQLLDQLKGLISAKLRWWTRSYYLNVVVRVMKSNDSTWQDEERASRASDSRVEDTTDERVGTKSYRTRKDTQPFEQSVKDLEIRITGQATALRHFTRDEVEPAMTASLFLHPWKVFVSRDSVSQDSTSMASVSRDSLSTESVSQSSVSQDSVSQSSASKDSAREVWVSQSWVTQDAKCLNSCSQDSVSNDSVYLMRRLSAINDSVHADASYSELVSYEEDRSVEDDPRFPLAARVRLSSVLVCPYIRFNRSEYWLDTAAENPTDFRVTLLFGDAEGVLTDLEQSWLDDGSLYVCLEALRSLGLRETGWVPGGASWQYVLTMVVMPVSMACGGLTLAVYCILPALRTQPGLNTMGTCCALLLAQLSLLLAAHRVTSGAWCRALGLLVHLSWLCFFCWTSVCSTHMFHTFSASTRSTSSSSPSTQMRKLLRNVIISILAPALVAGSVVLGSSLATDGGSFGYSDVRCYLDSTLLVGLAMVLPASLLLLVNLALFVLTVRRIHEITQLNPLKVIERDSRQHLYACARLSVLTGATWILALVAEGAGIDWLQFFSILANGGQGVLLFLSYVTNRRVFAMLAVKLGRKQGVKSSSCHAPTTTTTADSHSGSSCNTKL